MKAILLSTPVGPLGTGLCGGVETTLYHLAVRLAQDDHQILVVAPQGSQLPGIPVKQVDGTLQPMMQLLCGITSVGQMITLPKNSVLENMCESVREIQNNADIILNFAYDWLPLYLTGFYQCPIVHWLTLCSCSEAMDSIIFKAIQKYPGHIAAFTQAQADTYKLLPKNSLRILGGGVPLNFGQFCPQADPFLAWAGRISPEKGLEDAFAAAIASNNLLKVMGCMQDQAYWNDICRKYPRVQMEYLGFLPQDQFQSTLRKAKALLVLSKCAEAFGNVAAEALACGVPVIAYRQGGLAEIVRHGQTGYLIEPGHVEELVEAIAHIDHLDRRQCRQQAEREFSFDVLAHKVEKWLQEMIQARGKP